MSGANASALRDAGLLEREDALRSLEQFVDGVVERRGGTAVVEGPPGIGKSQVLRVIARSAVQRGLRVAFASGAELEQDLPFVVVRQLYDAVTSQDEALDRGAVTRLLATPSDRLARPDIGTVLTRLLAGVVDYAAAQPILFVVDDAQWADPDSVRALHYLARRCTRDRVGLLLGMRPTGGDSALDEVVRLAAAPPVRLGALTEGASEALLSRLLGRRPTPSFVETCHAVTNGNPLLLHELARELVSGGHPLDPGVVLLLGSASVARTALNRVGRLTPAAVPVARAVAVLGQRASTPRVARLAGLALEEAAEVVAALVNAELLTDTVPLGWVHPLIASAVYRHTPAAERARLHAAAARLFDADGVPVDEVAAHLLHAEPAGDPWAVERLRSAAYHAATVGGLEHAARLLRRALDEPAGAQTGEVLLELGQLETWTFDRAASGHLREAFERHPTAAGRCQAATALARLLALAARWSEAQQVLDAALSSVPDDEPSLERLTLESEWLLVADGGALSSVARAQRVEALSTAGPHDEAARVTAVHRAGAAIESLTPAEQVREWLRSGWAEGQLLRDQGVDSPLWLYLGWRLAAFEDAAGAREVYAAVHAMARRQGSAVAALQAEVALGWLALDCGDLDAADAALGAATAIPLPGPSVGARVIAGGRALLGLHRGALGDALHLLAPYPHPGPDRADRYDALVSRVRGLVHLAGGDLAGARACFEQVRRWAEGSGYDGPGEWSWRPELARTLALMGDTGPAATLATEALRQARVVGLRRPEGRALRALAATRPLAARTPLLEQAVEALQAVDPLEQAASMLDLARVHERLGDQTAARSAATTALDSSGRLGAEALQASALDLLHRLGARPRRAALTGPDALTASERRVADLVAQGLTNREVAARLLVSEKTVEKHLSATFRKLEVTEREQVGEMLTKE